ncbi:hypothetical protein KCU67_g5457, partial [Aureobasidium melanogenum]
SKRTKTMPKSFEQREPSAKDSRKSSSPQAAANPLEQSGNTRCTEHNTFAAGRKRHKPETSIKPVRPELPFGISVMLPARGST